VQSQRKSGLAQLGLKLIADNRLADYKRHSGFVPRFGMFFNQFSAVSHRPPASNTGHTRKPMAESRMPRELLDLKPTGHAQPLKLGFVSWVRFLILHVFSPKSQVRLGSFSNANLPIFDYYPYWNLRVTVLGSFF